MVKSPKRQYIPLIYQFCMHICIYEYIFIHLHKHPGTMASEVSVRDSRLKM